MIAVWERVGEWVKKLKMIKYKLPIIKMVNRDIKYSTGNTVGNIVITVQGARRVQKISGEHFVE